MDFFKKYPLASSVIINTVKSGGADYIVQKYVERKPKINRKRLAMFTGLGCFYSGIGGYMLFGKAMPIFEKKLASIGYNKPMIAAAVTGVDLFIHDPFICLPIFYLSTCYTNGKNYKHAIQLYKENAWTDCRNVWKLWIPSNMINFTFVPLHLRLPVMTMTSFLWSMYFSFLRGELK